MSRLKAVYVKGDNDDAYFLRRFSEAETAGNLDERMDLEEQRIKAAQEDTRSVEAAYAEFESANRN